MQEFIIGTNICFLCCRRNIMILTLFLGWAICYLLSLVSCWSTELSQRLFEAWKSGTCHSGPIFLSSGQSHLSRLRSTPQLICWMWYVFTVVRMSHLSRLHSTHQLICLLLFIFLNLINSTIASCRGSFSSSSSFSLIFRMLADWILKLM